MQSERIDTLVHEGLEDLKPFLDRDFYDMACSSLHKLVNRTWQEAQAENERLRAELERVGNIGITEAVENDRFRREIAALLQANERLNAEVQRMQAVVQMAQHWLERGPSPNAYDDLRHALAAYNAGKEPDYLCDSGRAPPGPDENYNYHEGKEDETPVAGMIP